VSEGENGENEVYRCEGEVLAQDTPPLLTQLDTPPHASFLTSVTANQFTNVTANQILLRKVEIERQGDSCFE